MRPPDVASSLIESSAGVFDPSALADQPEPVQRHLRQAIAAGTPVATSARLEMRGHIKLGRWLPFRASELLAPLRGFIWQARVAGVVTGSDRLIDGHGAMDWKVAGIVPLVHVQGEDVTRSAAGRAGGESLWLPTALLPEFGVGWTAETDEHVTCRFDVDGVPLEVEYHLDARGDVVSTAFDRWGDPDRTGTWGWHRCGGEVTAHRSFGGYRIPSAGRFGWHYGTDRWADGEFFRYRITALDPITSDQQTDGR